MRLVQAVVLALMLGGFALGAAGIAVLAGLGWTLLFLGVCSIGLALVITRGVSGG